MTPEQKIIDHELAQFGWVESIATNSIIDFKSPNIDIEEQKTYEKKSDFTDTFICHMIFYVIFCYSLFLYVLIDLNFGTFLKKYIKFIYKSNGNLLSSFVSFFINKYRLG